MIKKALLTRYSFFLATCFISSQLYGKCGEAPYVTGKIDQQTLITNLTNLSSDLMEGRKTESVGNKRALDLISSLYAELQLNHFDTSFTRPFTFKKGFKEYQGNNIVGYQTGTKYPNQYLVISAHYDHIGKKGSRVYNGADDNASGVAGMIAMAKYFQKKPPHYSIIYLATDAEELGLYGAKAFVGSPPIPLKNIKLNVNMDMISQGGRKKRLYVAGTRKYKHLKPLINAQLETAQVCLKKGHDSRRVGFSGRAGVNWAKASDHAAFDKHDIPYLYFGVDVHKRYHQLTDTVDKIDPTFYTAAVESIINTVEYIDSKL